MANVTFGYIERGMHWVDIQPTSERIAELAGIISSYKQPSNPPSDPRGFHDVDEFEDEAEDDEVDVDVGIYKDLKLNNDEFLASLLFKNGMLIRYSTGALLNHYQMGVITKILDPYVDQPNVDWVDVFTKIKQVLETTSESYILIIAKNIDE